MSALLILNGPNLNLLGQREPAVYGTTTLGDVETAARTYGDKVGARIGCAQSNSEGGLIDHLHAARGQYDGVILNAGGYTHTSIALHDAILGIEIPTIELHISNVHAREGFRHRSMIAPACIGVICGFGVAGYPLAIDAMLRHLEKNA